MPGSAPVLPRTACVLDHRPLQESMLQLKSCRSGVTRRRSKVVNPANWLVFAGAKPDQRAGCGRWGGPCDSIRPGLRTAAATNRKFRAEPPGRQPAVHLSCPMSNVYSATSDGVEPCPGEHHITLRNRVPDGKNVVGDLGAGT